MAKNGIRVCIKRKKNSVEKEANCKRRIRGLLQMMNYRCPTTDFATLRAEAELKLHEIRKRKRFAEDSNRSETAVREIKKVRSDESIITSSVYSLDSTTTKGQSKFNSSYGGGKCREFKHGNKTQKPELSVSPKVKRYIKEIEGSEMAELVYEKKLTASDVRPSQSRLLMPLNQVKGQDILTEMQRRETVQVYVPESQRNYELCLTRWSMNGRQYYVLKTGWNDVVKENKLDENMVVQIWAFQVGDNPCLLLVRVDGGNGVSDDSNGGVSYDEGDDVGISSTRGSEKVESSRS